MLLYKVLSIYLIILCLPLSGCGKSDVGIFDKNTNGVESKAIQEGNLSDEDEEKATDYSNYLKKIWIVENWTAGAYEFPSFVLMEIENGIVKGKYSTYAVAEPDFYFYTLEESKYLGQLSGEVMNEPVTLKFSDGAGNTGNVVLTLDGNGVNAEISYLEKGENYKDIDLDGEFDFKPYNLENIEDLETLDEYSTHVDLNSWGAVKFVAGEVDTGDKIHPVAYITDDDNNILYVFKAPYKVGTRISSVTIEDINNDNLIDIKIITEFIYDDEIEPIEWVFMQQEDGMFYSNRLLKE